METNENLNLTQLRAAKNAARRTYDFMYRAGMNGGTERLFLSRQNAWGVYMELCELCKIEEMRVARESRRKGSN